MSGTTSAILAEPDSESAVAAPGAEIALGYEVIEHMSRGDALDVYDVWSEKRCCRCVAKLLRPDRIRDERPLRRLLTEGRLLERLAHPNLVRAYETIAGPSPVVILESLSGETLSYTIDTQARRLPASDVASLGLALCSAVAYLHDQGYLHRDLKPDNVINDRGTAKLIDLSLATPPGQWRRGAGTRSYMAPEQARGDRLDAFTDVFGIGAVLYEAATGLPPFDPRREGTDYPQLTRRADPVRAHRRLPTPLAVAIDACLEPEPEARPTVMALGDLLDGLTRYGRRGIPDV